MSRNGIEIDATVPESVRRLFRRPEVEGMDKAPDLYTGIGNEEGEMSAGALRDMLGLGYRTTDDNYGGRFDVDDGDGSLLKTPDDGLDDLPDMDPLARVDRVWMTESVHEESTQVGDITECVIDTQTDVTVDVIVEPDQTEVAAAEFGHAVYDLFFRRQEEKAMNALVLATKEMVAAGVAIEDEEFADLAHAAYRRARVLRHDAANEANRYQQVADAAFEILHNFKTGEGDAE